MLTYKSSRHLHIKDSKSNLYKIILDIDFLEDENDEGFFKEEFHLMSSIKPSVGFRKKKVLALKTYSYKYHIVVEDFWVVTLKYSFSKKNWVLDHDKSSSLKYYIISNKKFDYAKLFL